MYGNSTTNKFLWAKNNKLSSENKSCTINDFKCQGLTLRWDCLIENVFFADQAREGKKLSFTVFLLFELYKERGWRSLFAGNQNLFLKSYFVDV